MKVLHVVPTMQPGGGIPATVRGLVLGLRRRTVHCEIVTASGPKVGYESLPVPGVPVHRFRTDAFSRVWLAHSRELGQFLPGVSGGFDLIHAHQAWAWTTWAAHRSAHRNRRPFVLSTHGDLDSWVLSYKGFRKNAYRRLVLNRMIRTATALHAVAAAEADGFAELGYKTPSFVIHNGIDPQEARRPGSLDGFLSRHPLPVDKQVVLFLGRLHPQKGLDLLAPAFASVVRERPDTKLLVAGPDCGARAVMESALGNNGALDSAVFSGLLTGRDKQAALQRADIFVLPSYSEGFPNAVLEAMAAGLPVVLSEQCNMPEVAREGAGFVVPTDEAAVSGAVITLLENPDLRLRMGDKARSLATQRYTWDIAAEAMKCRYAALIDKRGPA